MSVKKFRFVSPGIFINEIDTHNNIEILAFEDALESDSIGLTTKEAQNDASNDD